MRIAFDLRGLNYQKRTGINTYTLHVLYCFSKIKKRNKNLHVVGIGIDTGLYTNLVQEYPFFVEVFDEVISLNDYLGFPKFLTRKSIQIILFFLNSMFGMIYWKAASRFDHIFLPQPKPFLLHPNSQLITSFHDLFSIFDYKQLSLKARMLEHKKIYSLLSQYSQKVITNSIATSIDCQDFLETPYDKIKLIYPALPKWNEISKNTISNSEIKQIELPKNPYFLALSGIERRKNWLGIIEGYCEFCDLHSDIIYDLVIAGSVVDSEYLEEIKTHLSKFNQYRIHLFTEIDEKLKDSLLSGCYAFVYPSFFEGFGFPILEACNYNKPIITSRVGSMPEIAQNCAVYVNPLLASDIASGMAILALDTIWYKRLSDNTHSVSSKFSWIEMEEEIEKLLINNAKNTSLSN
jgi:glycosyltransferase involved in cell wall biosynthesis